MSRKFHLVTLMSLQNGLNRAGIWAGFLTPEMYLAFLLTTFRNSLSHGNKSHPTILILPDIQEEIDICIY
jgi:hypothetical protein